MYVRREGEERWSGEGRPCVPREGGSGPNTLETERERKERRRTMSTPRRARGRGRRKGAEGESQRAHPEGPRGGEVVGAEEAEGAERRDGDGEEKVRKGGREVK